jgi:hypothetical protein
MLYDVNPTRNFEARIQGIEHEGSAARAKVSTIEPLAGVHSHKAMECLCGVEAMMQATVIQQRKLEHMRLYIKAREGRGPLRSCQADTRSNLSLGVQLQGRLPHRRAGST